MERSCHGFNVDGFRLRRRMKAQRPAIGLCFFPSLLPSGAATRAAVRVHCFASPPGRPFQPVTMTRSMGTGEITTPSGNRLSERSLTEVASSSTQHTA